MSSDFDYEDFGVGGGSMSIRRHSRRLPYRWYKHTEEFRQNQMAKPLIASRDPLKSELRHWQTEDGRGHVNEVGGRRVYLGQCEDCDDVVLEIRHVSDPEFRGRGNPGHCGRWPALCEGCRERHRQESIERRRDEKRRSDRERIAHKRALDRLDASRPVRTEGYWYRDDNGEEQWMPGSWIG